MELPALLGGMDVPAVPPAQSYLVTGAPPWSSRVRSAPVSAVLPDWITQ
jgi:hypothetical protein